MTPPSVFKSEPAVEQSSHAGRDVFGLGDLWQLCQRYADGAVGDPLIGKAIGDVVLVRLIGQGGMGRVYEGLQQPIKRVVAVKVLWNGQPTAESVRRFAKESQILGRLVHPGISQIFSAGTCDVAGVEVPYFVMEYVRDAQAIVEYVRHRDLAHGDIASLFARVCDAVGHGHAHGVVHRDLKPGNILIDSAGNPKVIDFGVAREESPPPGQTQFTATGRLLGTLQYMSPELSRCDNGKVGPASDVYAIGLILYEAILGEPPYDVSRAGIVTASKVIQDYVPSFVGRHMDRISPGLRAVLQRCLRKKPEERFRDGLELRDAIRNAITREDWKSPRLRKSGRLFRHGCFDIGGTSLAQGAVLMICASIVCGLTALVITLFHDRRETETIDSGFAFVLPVGVPFFTYGFRDVCDDEADRYIIGREGVTKYEREYKGLRVTSWVPTSAGVEGHLVFCFDFLGLAETIHLRAASTCWSEGHHATAGGRGASAIEVSPDGEVWTTLCDNIADRQWGRNWAVDGDLGAHFQGCRSLWVRVRLLAEGDSTMLGAAEFARSSADAKRNVFQVAAYAD